MNRQMPNLRNERFRKLFEGQRDSFLYTRAGQSALAQNEDFQIQRDDLFDEGDLSTTELEQSMRLRLRNREALFLRKIEEALARISEGTFGVCADCGENIEEKRLEARPTTDVCVLCKEEAERLEQLHIDGHRLKSVGQKARFA